MSMFILKEKLFRNVGKSGCEYLCFWNIQLVLFLIENGRVKADMVTENPMDDYLLQ